MRPGPTRRIVPIVLLTALFGLLPGGASPASADTDAKERDARGHSMQDHGAKNRSATDRGVKDHGATDHRAKERSAKERSVRALGFDTCEAPTTQSMQAWRDHSPYSVVGVYVAGDNRACKSERLTPEWVAAVRAQGWDFLPLQVGRQAPCTRSEKTDRIDPARAAEQGVVDADEIVDKASALGFAPGSAVWFDMEAYDGDDVACRTAVLDFVSAWIGRVRELGFVAGYYSSLDSGIRDQIGSNGTRYSPDAIWYADWNGDATTTGDGAIPDGFWTDRRVHQYSGNVVETHGGVRITIDRNVVDGPVAVFRDRRAVVSPGPPRPRSVRRPRTAA